jgi:phosphoglycolate phosphatase
MAVKKAEMAFVFDLDGTLFDSKEQICRAVDITVKLHGWQTISRRIISEKIGLPASELFSQLNLAPTLVDMAVTSFRTELKRQVLVENLVFPGAVALLNKIKGDSYRIGVATSKPTELAELVIQNSVLTSLVDYVQGTEGFAAKPDPEVILRCLRNLGVKSGFMIGDRPEDMMAGNEAGLIAVGVAQSHFSQGDLLASGASYSVASLEEMHNFLGEIINLTT